MSLDVTELHRQREEAREAEAFSAAVLAASPDAIVVHDFASGRSVYASRTAADLLTPGPDGATDADVHPDDRVRLAGALTACGDLEDDQVLQVRYRVQAAPGAARWLSRRLTAFRRGPDGRTTEVLSVIRDVSEMVAAEDQLRHAARHDPLTGLPNRTLLTDRLGGALARAQWLGQDIAVLYCDLDGFKRVNDANGHAAGDLLLRETADRLRSVLRPQDTVARVGGDEFVLVLEADGENAPRSGTADRRATPASGPESSRTLGIDVARRVVAALAEPVLIDGVEHVISASVGLAYAGGPGSTRTAEDVLRDADAAMYRAKAAGKDRFEVFENGLRTDLAERGRVERLLRRAVHVSRPPGVPSPRLTVADGARLDVAYQPVYGGAKGRLEGFEALARLSDEAGRPVPPDLFIAVAEDTGLIRPLGHEVLRQACRQLAAWRYRHAHADHLTVAVNLSARQAQHPALADEVMAALGEEGLPADLLVLELTESVLLQAGAVDDHDVPPAPGRRHRHRDRRLRHWLRQPALPGRAPGQRRQDRPELHRRTAARPDPRHHRPRRGPARPRSRSTVRRRRRRDDAAAPGAAARGQRSGLPARQARHGRRRISGHRDRLRPVMARTFRSGRRRQLTA